MTNLHYRVDSIAQIALAFVRRAEGFTLDLDGAHVRPKSKAYAVADRRGLLLPTGDCSPVCLRSALKQLLHQIQWARITHPAGRFIGGWFDSESGSFEVALTAVVYTRRAAFRLATTNLQRSVFELSSRTEVPTTRLLSASRNGRDVSANVKSRRGTARKEFEQQRATVPAGA